MRAPPRAELQDRLRRLEESVQSVRPIVAASSRDRMQKRLARLEAAVASRRREGDDA